MKRQLKNLAVVFIILFTSINLLSENKGELKKAESIGNTLEEKKIKFSPSIVQLDTPILDHNFDAPSMNGVHYKKFGIFAKTGAHFVIKDGQLIGHKTKRNGKRHYFRARLASPQNLAFNMKFKVLEEPKEFHIEFGHGKGIRTNISTKAVHFTAGNGQQVGGLGSSNKLNLKANEWQIFKAELLGDELLITLNGKSFYIKNLKVKQPRKDFQINVSTELYIDEFTLWKVKEEPQKKWSVLRGDFQENQ